MSAAIPARISASTASSAAMVRNARTTSPPISAVMAALPVSAIRVPGLAGGRLVRDPGALSAIYAPDAPGSRNPPSSGHRYGGQDRLQDPVRGGSLELGLGPELNPVPEGRPGQRLHVVGRDVVP